MRLIAYIGLGLLAIGALVFIASSGAFDSTTADRGVEIETANDAHAFLGLEYSTESRTVELQSDDSNDGGFCFFVCPPYEYIDRELITVADNTPSGELEVEEIEFDESGDDIIDDLEYTDANIVHGDFSCPVDGPFIGTPDQESRSATVTIDIEASDGAITVDLERAIEIECVADN